VNGELKIGKVFLKCYGSGDHKGRMWITSLNSHFYHYEPQHKILRRKKAEPKTPHFLSLNQDKCGLK
jgi:hypothetical protein